MLLLKTCLSSSPDPRRAQGKVYDLSHLLLFSILAVLSGAPSYRKIQRFIHARREWLNALCGLYWKRAPAHTSIRYTLPGLPVKAVERAFRQHAAHLASDLPEVQQIALDGKTLRGSFDRFEDQKAVQLFSALAIATPLVLGHVLISDQNADKRHEIPAAQQLIQDLNLPGRLFTLDALHAPKKTVEMICKTENYLLVPLKRNQPTLYDRLLAQVVPQPATTVHHSHEVGQHNRLERRTVSVWPLAAGTGTEPWHDHCQTFIQVERQTEVFDTRRKAWTPRDETAYYLATTPLTAAHAATLIRDHGGIENRLHYVRDVTLREDASRIRRNPGLFAVLRSFALNLLRFNGIQNISQALYDNALDFNRVLAYQGL